ncbi:MAG: 3D domain-containing protein, partial [Gaiellaceae bacterium]
ALAAQQARLGRTLRDAHSAERRLASARSQRLSFVSRLRARKQLADQEINSLLTTAKAVEHKSETIAPPSAAADSNGDAPQAPASQGGRTLVVSATGYSLPGHTATGMPVGWGVVAVDPSVIPLGTRMTVPGYGEAVAADTGSAVKGADIDLWFPTLSQARAWGRRTVTIVLH